MLVRTSLGVATSVVVGAVAAAAIAYVGPLLPLHTPGANANRRAAHVDARRILSLARLPAGATAESADPARRALLKSAALSTAGGALVDLHRFYRVPGSPNAVLAWLRDHPPAGTRPLGSGTVSGPGYRVDGLAFSLRPTDRESARSLVVSVTAARGDGTALRVDAQVVWIVPRQSTEAVPRGVRLVTATGRSVDILTGRVTTTGPADVTAPDKVARIVRLVNELPIVQPGAIACPLDTGAGAVLKFYDRQGGAVVAQADAGASGCGVVGFWLQGRVEPALSGGPGLIDRVNRLLGTHL
jgi:hypothetical protein